MRWDSCFGVGDKSEGFAASGCRLIKALGKFGMKKKTGRLGRWRAGAPSHPIIS